MADTTKVFGDLKKRFQHYDEYKTCLDDLDKMIKRVNTLNKTSAGDDEIGQAYHQQVDKPTENLTETIAYVRKRLGVIVDGGYDTADIMNKADDESKTTADNW
ncbi:hypothetical protein [Streptomyces sp. NPDC090025]|uniref:hypothetical protein n=1 Tax=Streptomyces sp. NPDC090025 TaxID=3365922 RepID=UPI0038329B0F